MKIVAETSLKTHAICHLLSSLLVQPWTHGSQLFSSSAIHLLIFYLFSLATPEEKQTGQTLLGDRQQQDEEKGMSEMNALDWGNQQIAQNHTWAKNTSWDNRRSETLVQLSFTRETFLYLFLVQFSYTYCKKLMLMRIAVEKQWPPEPSVFLFAIFVESEIELMYSEKKKIFHYSLIQVLLAFKTCFIVVLG